MAEPLTHSPSLPTRRAFVVQFRAEADLEHERFIGRVEHVVSGQTKNFFSVEELIAFFTCVVRTAQGPRTS